MHIEAAQSTRRFDGELLEQDTSGIYVRGPIRIGGVVWWLPEGSEPETLAPALARSAAAWREGALVDRKRGRRKALFGLHLAGAAGSEASGPADHLLKVTRYGGLAGVRRRVRGSKARLELARAEAVAARGLPVPMPVAAGEWRSGPTLRACLLLLRVQPGVVDLRQLLEAGDLHPRRRRQLAEALGRLARRMAEAGLFQDDFAPNNVLVRKDDPRELSLIDFERAQLRPRLDPVRRRAMLAKLHRELPAASATQRMRFLRAYGSAAGGEIDARALWRELEPEIARRAARDLARMRRTASRAGRRFRPFREGRIRGFLRDPDPLARRLAAAPEAPESPLPAGYLAWRGQRLRFAQARELWVRQAWLAGRGLGAVPRALGWTPRGACILVVERPVGALASTDLAPGAREAALSVLLAKTLALGELAEPVDPGGLTEAAGFVQPGAGPPCGLWIAPPPGLHVTGRPQRDGATRARRLARGIARPDTSRD